MQHHHFNISRRSFLSTTARASMAAALASLTDIPFVMKRALAEQGIGLNGKKILFIWLRGANDGLNSVIPIEDPSYATSRPGLFIPKDPATTYSTPGGCDFPTSGSASTYGSYPFAIRAGNSFAALHPSLKFLAPVYNAGDLALIHRVGYVRQSRSHFDSQNFWENGTPNNNLVKDGIFYRAIFESGLANTAPLTGVSFQSSLPLILRGSKAAMTNLTDPNRYNLLGIPSPSGEPKADAALDAGNQVRFTPRKSRDLLQLQYENLQKTLGLFSQIDFTENGNTFRDDVVTDEDAVWAAANGGEGYYLFPTTNTKNGGWRRSATVNDGNKYVVDPGQQSFFTNLKAAALVLNRTDAIIAGTELGGFDTHQNQGKLTGAHPNLNRSIGWAIYALRKYFTRYADKATWNNVVVITLSEFGRTTVENSDAGTDHAEASAMFMAGGAVRGYNKGNPSGIFNCQPQNEVLPWVTGGTGSMFGVNSRYLRRNTDFRSVLGEVIRKHLGASANQITRIIPGYGVPGEYLLSGGRAPDGTDIRGEIGLL